MSTHTASCRCGQLRVTVTGDPIRVSVCHCLDCQKRSGSAFAAQARWPIAQVTVAGESKTWIHQGENGQTDFHFCPECGSGFHYRGGGYSDAIAVAIGAFDDPYFLKPEISVFESRKHDWLEITGAGIEHD